MSVNIVVLEGRLTREPERFQAGEVEGMTFGLAVNRSQTRSDFFTVKAFDKRNKAAIETLHKGSRIFVTGHLEGGAYTSKKTGKTGYSCELVAEDIRYGDTSPVLINKVNTTVEEIFSTCKIDENAAQLLLGLVTEIEKKETPTGPAAEPQENESPFELYETDGN